MTDVFVHEGTPGLDDDATEALREILSDPALPVASTFTAHPDLGIDEGRRIAALREAHDYLTSRRVAAVAAQSVDAAASFIADLRQVEPVLAATLHWHAVLASTIASLPVSRARNAVLGDVSRGELLTWAPRVRSWAWVAAPDPIGKADAKFDVDEFPGLYDAVVSWQPGVGLVVIPTHRERVSWEPVGSGNWVVRLAQATVHVDEVIALETDPRMLASQLVTGELT